MLEKLRANIAVNLKFYRRNRLLAGIAILFLAIAGVYVAGSLLFSSATSRFDLTRELFSQLTVFGFLFVAVVGLVLVSVHVRGKAVKLVFTKPCPPEIWLASAFTAAILLSFVLYLGILATVSAFSLVWKIPLQAGFAYIAGEMFLESIIAMSYMTFLSVVMHPVIAVIIVIVFNETIFFEIRTGLIAAIKYTGGSIALPILERVTYVMYLITPMFAPYDEQADAVRMAMRVEPGHWQYLALTASYAMTITALLYLLSAAALRRKNFV